MTLLELYEKCLHAKYTHTDNGGDYAIEVEGNKLYLLFEWSDGKEDWRNNFDFPARPYKRMDETWFCHRGFMRVWKAMRDEIEEKVKAILTSTPDIDKIICVGYSHGAALAVFATEDMVYLYGDTHSVAGYGFGGPRVLWGIVPKAVKERLRNFTLIRNIPDIVTHVPPALFGFRHVGKLIRLGRLGKYGPFKAHRSESYIAELPW